MFNNASGYTVNKFLWDAAKVTTGLSAIAMIPIAAFQASVYGTRYLVGAYSTNVNHHWATPMTEQLAKIDPKELKKLLASNPSVTNSLIQGSQPMMVSGK